MKFPLSVVLLGGLVLLPVRLDAQTLQVTHNVNLRSDPSTEHPSLGLLKPPLQLTQLQPDQEDGYYFVRTPVGEEGWVWAKNVRLVTEPEAVVPLAGAVSAFDPTWDKPEPNKSTFTNVDGKVCGYGGEGDEVAQNQRKNRTDVPTSYHDVTFDALASLPYPYAGAQASLRLDCRSTERDQAERRRRGARRGIPRGDQAADGQPREHQLLYDAGRGDRLAYGLSRTTRPGRGSGGRDRNYPAHPPPSSEVDEDALLAVARYARTGQDPVAGPCSIPSIAII